MLLLTIYYVFISIEIVILQLYTHWNYQVTKLTAWLWKTELKVVVVNKKKKKKVIHIWTS